MTRMPNENDSIDIQRLIAEVAARHRFLLKPDDPAIALVTMNQLILDDAMEPSTSRSAQRSLNFMHLCRKRRSAREVCWLKE